MQTNAPYNENDLLTQLAEGDEQAFISLYNHYRANIYTTALRITSSSVIAEEVVQDVFLKCWLNRQKLSSVQYFKAWLHGVAEHTIYDAMRRMYREKRDREYEYGELIDRTTQEALVHKDYDAILQQAIKRLPEKQRKTYIFIRQEGLKREEVARLLGVSPETVKWNLDQAVRSVRAYCLSHLDIGIGLLICLQLKK